MPAQSKIFNFKKYSKLKELIISTQTSDTVILIDIDDTIIIPSSQTFNYYNKYRSIIDELKAQNYQNPPAKIEQIIGNWRLSRAIRLVDDNWPVFIKQLKQYSAVYALTQLNTGTCGPIASVSEWRYNELKQLGIEFTNNFNNQESNHEFLTNKDVRSANFYHGIFITGGFKKSELLNKITKIDKSIKKIIIVDDRQEQISQLAITAQDLNIDFIGIIYRGIELIKVKLNLAASRLQCDHLKKTAEWLTDEQAASQVTNI